MNNDDYHKQFFDPNWYFGGLNMFKVSYGSGNMMNYERYEFPPLMSNPQVSDVFQNFNKSEIGIMTFFFMIGIRSVSEVLSKKHNFNIYFNKSFFFKYLLVFYK